MRTLTIITIFFAMFTQIGCSRQNPYSTNDGGVVITPISRADEEVWTYKKDGKWEHIYGTFVKHEHGKIHIQNNHAHVEIPENMLLADDLVFIKSEKRRTAVIYVKQLALAVELYQNDIWFPPTTEQGLRALFAPPSDIPNPAKWNGPYLNSNATDTDPWGNPYQYTCPGSHAGFSFDIWSFGPDGINGTEDDIGQWTAD